MTTETTVAEQLTVERLGYLATTTYIDLLAISEKTAGLVDLAGCCAKNPAEHVAVLRQEIGQLAQFVERVKAAALPLYYAQSVADTE